MTAPSLHDDIEEDREGEQRCRRRIDRESQNRDCTCGKQKPESERLSTRYSDDASEPPLLSEASNYALANQQSFLVVMPLG